MAEDKEIQYEFDPVTVNIKAIVVDELFRVFEMLNEFQEENDDDDEHRIARSINTLRIVLRLVGKEVE